MRLVGVLEIDRGDSRQKIIREFGEGHLVLGTITRRAERVLPCIVVGFRGRYGHRGYGLDIRRWRRMEEALRLPFGHEDLHSLDERGCRGKKAIVGAFERVPIS